MAEETETEKSIRLARGESEEEASLQLSFRQNLTLNPKLTISVRLGSSKLLRSAWPHTPKLGLQIGV